MAKIVTPKGPDFFQGLSSGTAKILAEVMVYALYGHGYDASKEVICITIKMRNIK
jgi:hypothetical protein